MELYRYILLDWDGNLVRTLDLWLQSLKTPLEKRGYTFTDNEIGANFALFQERMEKRGVTDLDDIMAEANTITTQGTPQLGLYQDALATLKLLRDAHKQLALVTTSSHGQVDPLLDRHGLRSFFDAIVCGDDVTHHKPHPEPLEKALTDLNAPKNKTIMVGDSESDILAAHNAGIDSILFFPPEHATFYDITKLKRLKPTYIVGDFREIAQIAAQKHY